jgi:stage II sporulation protein D
MVLSKTGAYEGVVTPFSANWESKGGRLGHQDGGSARISVKEAEDMARNGQHAAQILSRAFPGSHIEIIY